ncbi:hypothetical protein HDU67_002404 [Dinochytrium kinnereticum]|nr:hypothetical protein HDU67_002404 [Dinochytrium kinnereticum]
MTREAAAKSELKHLMHSLETLYDDLGLSPDAEQKLQQQPAQRTGSNPTPPADHQPSTVWNSFYSNLIGIQTKPQGSGQVGRPRKVSDPTGGSRLFQKSIRGNSPSTPNLPVRRPSWIENYTTIGTTRSVSASTTIASPVSTTCLTSNTTLPSPPVHRRRPSITMLFTSAASAMSLPRAPPPKAPLPPLPDGAAPPAPKRRILTSIPELSAPPTFAKWRRRRGSKSAAPTTTIPPLSIPMESSDPKEVAEAAVAASVAAGEISMILGAETDKVSSPVLPGSPLSPRSQRRKSLFEQFRAHGQLRL